MEEEKDMFTPSSVQVNEAVYELGSSKDLDPLMKRIGDARIVLLGEASHGTHEFYTWRTQISKRLIQEKHFNFIAVEGDWPDCYRINRYIKGHEPGIADEYNLLSRFNRWPTWMWANWEVAALVNWLKTYNTGKYENQKAGFYGLDVYSLWESMEALMQYLQKTDPAAAKAVQKAMRCFEPYQQNGHKYAEAQFSLSQPCRDEVITLLKEIVSKAPFYDHDPEASLNSEQNAYITVNAEKYYSRMVAFNYESWNIRDVHMTDTLNRLLDFHGSHAKAIVWEHNTHIGDARYTSMKNEGMINIGQLVREQHRPQEVVLVGFGSYQGRVMAGRAWGEPMEEMELPPAKNGSVEALLHEEPPANKLLLFDHGNPKQRFKTRMPHRAVGVVYNPATEHYGNYVKTLLADRYDAFIFIDQTKALHPINAEVNKAAVPETYPFEF